MDEAQITALQEAAKDPDPAKFAQLARQIELAAVDKARGVEDTTAGLKKKNEELFTRDRERAVEMEALKAKALELDQLRADQEAEVARVAAEAVGTSAGQIDKLAEEKASVKMAALKSEWETNATAKDKRIEAIEADCSALTEKLREAMVDHLVYIGGGSEADQQAFQYLKSEAAPYFRPQVGEGQEPGSWWRQDRIKFDIIDPKTGTLLQNSDDKPMVPSDLITSKKSGGDWQWFFPNVSQGGGMSTSGNTIPGSTLPKDASAEAMFGSVLATPT